MTVVAPDWDRWRDDYEAMTFDEHRMFYDDVFVQCPEQQRFAPLMLADLLDHVGAPVSVGELGGWDGGFAAAMLADGWPIVRWVNYEISHLAVAASVCDDPRYEPVALDDWYWTAAHDEDVFVASHVLEHLTLADVERTVAVCGARWAYVQAPLPDNPRVWTGYRGTHILEVGWEGLQTAFEESGFRLLPALSGSTIRCFERDL